MVEGGISEAEAVKVKRLRKDAAEQISTEHTELIITSMEKADTRDGYNK